MTVAAESTPALSPDETARALIDILNAVLTETRGAGAPVITANLDSRLERDLGLDSLSRFELWLRVEQAFGACVVLAVEAGVGLGVDGVEACWRRAARCLG